MKKYRYIDIHGKTQKIFEFYKKEAQKKIKKSKKNPRWAVVVEAFDLYPVSSMPDRRKAIEHLIRVIKADLQQDAIEQKKKMNVKYSGQNTRQKLM